MKKIAIIGAGISGLFLGNLLQKSKKYDYKIFEKKHNLDLVDGYGIQLSVNSVKLLNNIGFKNISAQEVSYPKNVNFFEAKNCKLISSISISKFNTENHYYTTLKRSILIKFLLNNIPKDKIIFNSEVMNIEQEKKINLFFSNKNKEEIDHLAICDGIFSQSKFKLLKYPDNLKFYDSVALRGTIKNITNRDISLYLGPNFHFVIYPINQNNEFNFISIIKRKIYEKNLKDKDYFKKKEFIDDLLKDISSKTSLDFKDKIENILSFPIFVSKKFIKPEYNNVYVIGDALFAFPPSFAQGASQSIEASQEVFESIEGNFKNYYENRENKINSVYLRSIFNHFAFHVSNPITIFTRNIVLKYLSKNKKFLEKYLGKIYQ